jgi:hypothetical protein
MQEWASQPIHLTEELALQVRATSDGVDLGKNVGEVFASETLLTPGQANDLAGALVQAATKCRACAPNRKGE